MQKWKVCGFLLSKARQVFPRINTLAYHSKASVMIEIVKNFNKTETRVDSLVFYW